jgi:branched-chain amino acid transport system permease protein
MAAAAISGCFTGLGGGDLRPLSSAISTPTSSWPATSPILIALPAVLGGVGTLWGPLLGAAVLIPLKELCGLLPRRLRRRESTSMLYGALIVVVTLAPPQGLVSLFRRR